MKRVLLRSVSGLGRQRNPPAFYCRARHDDCTGDADVEAVRLRLDALLAANAPNIGQLSVARHDRGGFAVQFHCPESERIMLAEHLQNGGFRLVV